MCNNIFYVKTLRDFCRLMFLLTAGSLPATATELTEAFSAFPDIHTNDYRPDLAVRVANAFIAAGESNAVAALEDVIALTEHRLDSYRANGQICCLCRLIFVPNTPTNTLCAPMLGTLLSPLPQMTMTPSDWPHLPSIIVDDVPFFVATGYKRTDAGDRAAWYLIHCRLNGVLRAKPYPVPTIASASNALDRLFLSPAWRALKWTDSGKQDSYTLSEDKAKQFLRRQVDRMSVPASNTVATAAALAPLAAMRQEKDLAVVRRTYEAFFNAYTTPPLDANDSAEYADHAYRFHELLKSGGEKKRAAEMLRLVLWKIGIERRYRRKIAGELAELDLVLAEESTGPERDRLLKEAQSLVNHLTW